MLHGPVVPFAVCVRLAARLSAAMACGVLHVASNARGVWMIEYQAWKLHFPCKQERVIVTT